MRPRFQADNDFDNNILTAVRRRVREIDFRDARTARLHGLPDEEVLRIAAEQGRILISHDVTTMGEAFWACRERGMESPGLLLVAQSAPLRKVADSIVLIWSASDAEEYQNAIVWLPL